MEQERQRLLPVPVPKYDQQWRTTGDVTKLISESDELQKSNTGGGGSGTGNAGGGGDESDGPSAIVTRLVRNAGYDEYWPSTAWENSPRRGELDGIGLEESGLVNIQDVILRAYCMQPRTIEAPDDVSNGLIIYQSDAFLLFCHRTFRRSQGR